MPYLSPPHTSEVIGAEPIVQSNWYDAMMGRNITIIVIAIVLIVILVAMYYYMKKADPPKPAADPPGPVPDADPQPSKIEMLPEDEAPVTHHDRIVTGIKDSVLDDIINATDAK